MKGCLSCPQAFVHRSEQGTSHRHGETHGEHLHHREQAVAAPGVLLVQILEREAVHRGELHRIDYSKEEKLEPKKPKGLALAAECETYDTHAHQKCIEDQEASVTHASEQVRHKAFRQHPRHRHGQQSNACRQRREAQAKLQK